MQTEHLFELTYILLENECVTASKMAKHFGVSQRTIYRWVDALNLAGVPVFATKGKGGGIKISDKYALDKTVFTENEKFEILSSVQAFDALSGNKNSALLKLKTLTKNHSDWIQIDFAPWNEKMVQIRDLFNLIKNAILTQTQIQFDYYSTNRFSKARRVEPWKIIFRGQAWYLLGFCKSKNELRFFKLSRIENLKILSIQNKEKIQNYLEELKSNFDDSLGAENSLINLKLKIKNSEMYRILDEYKVDKIEKFENENINGENNDFSIISFQIPNFLWLENYILSFGANVKVIEPKMLRDKIEKIAHEIISLK